MELSQIASPGQLDGLSVPELEELCAQIREKIISAVSCNGGHLASNLGVVELTVAIHKVFHEKEDCIVWDVGHQAYTHKILTGRGEQLSTIRTKGGLSGYPNRRESEYDVLNAGHASTSISAAFGIANAKKISHDPGHVVAVIGDGALTGGLAYEGLNNAGRFNKNFIVILNDNKMSISRNVGSMARYLAHIRTQPGYLRMRGSVENVLDKMPVFGAPLHDAIKKSKTAIKHLLYNNTLFEDMGFAYYGPFDGHNMGELLHVLETAKNIEQPVLLHVITSKGRGYSYAEKNPGAFHGVSRFEISTGKTTPSGESFSSVFGSHLCELAEKDKRICAITAAMQMGTGLTEFSRRYPDRFFDVGIAEEHAITFSGGLAAGGMLPVCTLYSTFLQRGYDQIIHDAALQNVKVTLAIDRAGLVGEDGETHQGIFDVAFLNTVPNCTVYSPCYYEELYSAFEQVLYHCEGVGAVRYPRGRQLFKPAEYKPSREAFDLYGNEKSPVLLVTYGRLFSLACKAKNLCTEKGMNFQILKLNRVKPVDSEAVRAALEKKEVYFFEEGIEQGGVGEHFGFQLLRAGFRGKFHLHAIRNFVQHASMMESLRDLRLDDTSMAEIIMESGLENGAGVPAEGAVP